MSSHSTSPTGLEPHLDDILTDIRAAVIARHIVLRRRRRVGLAVAGAVPVAVAGTAIGSTLLGQPAPPAVTARLAAVDEGMPAALRFDPDIGHARSVAADGGSTLYLADLRAGGRCLVLVTDGVRVRGDACAAGDEAGQQPIDVSLPSDDGGGTDAPVTLAGAVNAPTATRLVLSYADGATADVQLAAGRFFVYDVPADRRAAAHGHELALTAYDDRGSVVATADIPADWDGAARPGDGPIRDLTTRSDSGDSTLVTGIDGVVDPARVATLEIGWPDGSTQAVAIDPEGRFSLTFTGPHIHALAAAAATLTAYDRDGRRIASQPFESLAAQRAGELHLSGAPAPRS